MMRRRLMAGATGLALAATGLITPSAIADPGDQPTSDVAAISAVVAHSEDPKAAAWQDLQFGLFMHWGVYSMFEGSYKGKPQGIGYPEQIKAWMKIPRDEYLAEAAKMSADKWDPAQICQTAKNAGMKYVMITSKHHDGFAMWDTATTDYDVVDQTAYGKDPIKELQLACNKIDMKLAFYFSIIDWEKHEPEPWQNVNPITDEHLQYNIAQIKELMTNYGPIAEFWFDMGGPTAAQSEAMAAEVRKWQPNTMVNSRVWNDKGDFEVGGDNAVPRDFRIGPWESILSIFPQCWSYCSTSKANRDPANLPIKAAEALDGLIKVTAGGGQYAYNVGPKGDGSLDPFDQGVLDALGEWHTRHPDAIDGAKATWFPHPDWGRLTTKGNALYFFPTSWKDGEAITLKGLANAVTRVSIDGTDTALPYEVNGTDLTVTLQGAAPDELRSVVKVELDGEPMMIPPQTVELQDSTGKAERVNLLTRNGAKNGEAVAIDAYVLDRSGKDYKQVDLEFTPMSGLSEQTRYKVTLGEVSQVFTGEELVAGPVTDFKLSANTVTRLRVELADPPYYATPMSLRLNTITITGHEEPQAGVAPAFRTQPQSTTVREGRVASFSASATGRPRPAYQWYRQNEGGEKTLIADATSSTYRFEASKEDNNATFFVVATNEVGQATSESAVLTVLPASENLALERPATQSTTGYGGVASRANDGNTDGVWDNNSVSHTLAYFPDPWWQVDLEGMYKLSKVNVWNRAESDECGGESCAERLKDFYVIASPKPLGDRISLDALLADPDVKAIRVEGRGGYPSTVDFEGFEAQYVRVVMPISYGPLSLAEVEVFGTSAAEAPTIEPLQASGEPEENFSTAGDGQYRTVTVIPGTLVTLEAQVSGTPAPLLQWQASTAAGEWEDIEEATETYLELDAEAEDHGTLLRLIATNSAGTATSQTVEIVVNESPTLQPVVLALKGGTAVELSDQGRHFTAAVEEGSQLTFTTEAAGRPAPSLRWRTAPAAVEQGEELVWTDVEGASAPTYEVTASSDLDQKYIQAEATNDVGKAASKPILLSVTKKAPEPLADGWQDTEEGRRYIKDGQPITGKWARIDGTWYLFDQAGSPRTGWADDRGTWYYMDADGAMRTGWIKDRGTWYYLNASGAMRTGWVKDRGTWYFLNASGAMRTGWVADRGAWYFLDSSGAMQTGWVADRGTWYYLSGSGAMRTGWVADRGTWYFLNGSGAMQTGWIKDRGTWYFLDSSGAMRTGCVNGYLMNASGAWVGYCRA